MAFARDEVEHFPRKKARAEPTRVSAVSALIFCPAEEKILVARRPANTLLGGLWELPGGELEAPRAPRKRTLTALLKTRLGVDIEARDLIGEVLHQFTHRTLTLEIFLAKTASERVVPLAFYDDARWVPLDRVASEVPVSTLTRKVLDLIDKTGVRP
jgi:adenine-specific DNA glycosylase